MLEYEKISDAQLLQMSSKIDYYVYDLDFTTITHATTAQNSFTIQADSSFIWMFGTCQPDIAAAAYTTAAVPVPLITCQIQDTASGRQLFSNPVPINAVFSLPGQRPSNLPTGRFFRANTQLTVTLTSYEASVDMAIRLQFHGMKRYTFNANHP